MANKSGTRAKGFVLTLEEYDKLKNLLNEKAKILGKRRNGKDKKEMSLWDFIIIVITF